MSSRETTVGEVIPERPSLVSVSSHTPVGPLLFVLDSVERTLNESSERAAISLAIDTLDWMSNYCDGHRDPSLVCALLRVQALASALGGRLIDASAYAASSIERAREAGSAVDLGRALLTGAAIERRSRHKGMADAMCREARSCFAAAGLTGWLEQVERERDRLGLRRGDGRALTPTERDVTELAAAGATNREIGHRLNIGVKTVEVHLTRAFRKLGVRRRSQLARVMGGGGPVSSADRPSR